MKLVRYLALGFCLFSTGCTAMRLFQSKVPAPIVKNDKQIEAERQGADLLARKILTPVELIPVAASLSASLGKPLFSLADQSNFIIEKASSHANEDLLAGIVIQQKQLATLNTKLTVLQGKSVDDTGISILGPGMVTIIIGLIILGVVFPPAFTLVGIAYRRLKQTSSMIVDQIDAAAKEPETAAAVAAIKDELKGKMDLVHKKVVSNLQKL